MEIIGMRPIEPAARSSPTSWIAGTATIVNKNSAIRACRVPGVNFVFFSARSASSSRGSLRCAALGLGSTYRGNEYFGRGAWVVGRRRSRYSVLGRIFNALKNEIDKRVVFLRGQDDQRHPAERETSRRLRPGHVLAPIPRLHPKPNNNSRGQNRQNVIGLVNQTTNQRRIRVRLIQVKHRAEILDGPA